LLVGDAAGLVNPYTGEGIAAALESGELAAKAATRMLQRKRVAGSWYGRSLCSRLRRNWALRDAPRHVQWLYEGAGVVDRTRMPLLAAVRAVVVDEPGALSRSGGVVDAEGTAVVRYVVAPAVSRWVRRLRRLDPVLAELVAELLHDPASPAVDPLVIGASIAHGERREDTATKDGILALATFVLTQDLMDHMAGAGQDALYAGNAAAITIGDCLLSEAVLMMKELPHEMVCAISRVASRSAAASRDPLTDCRSSAALCERYAAMAMPSACAAELAARGRGLSDIETRRCTAFAEWYTMTRHAVRDMARTSESAALRRMLSEVAVRTPPAIPFSAVFGQLADGLCGIVRHAAGRPSTQDGGQLTAP
jgi:hypothetical protein